MAQGRPARAGPPHGGAAVAPGPHPGDLAAALRRAWGERQARKYAPLSRMTVRRIPGAEADDLLARTARSSLTVSAVAARASGR